MNTIDSDLPKVKEDQEQTEVEPEKIETEKVEEQAPGSETEQPSGEDQQDDPVEDVSAAGEAQSDDPVEDVSAAEEAQSDDPVEDDPMADEAEDDDSFEDDLMDGSGVESGDFAALLEESLEGIQEGSVVKGTVVQVTDDFVVVDVGAKSEGQIPLHEFTDANGKIELAEGDEVEVLLESSEDDEGAVRLSRSKAARIKVWEKIAEAYQAEGTIEGTIVSRVKGGLQADVGVMAFLPGSQVDLRPVRDMEQFLGKTFEFRVLKYSKKRSNVVLSRRVILEEERNSQKTKLMEVLEEDKVLPGVVKNITDYGVFVDLGGLDGLLHITDISWGRVGHPSERYSVGDEIDVKVLSFDRERERVSLGVKQLTPDPWSTVEDKFSVGTRIQGKVVSLTDYGSFIEIADGVEGLVHVSEMSWTRRIRHPSKILQVGDIVESVVLNVDPERKRISLGMKQIMPDPWETIDETYPVGTTIEGRIKNVTDFGVFIGIEDGIDGLVHISDLSWSKRIKHPTEVYKKNDLVKAVVLNIDKENRRFSLGIKQAQIDPWESVAERYPVGSVVEGTVTNVTDFGIFVEIEEGIEGLIHVSEISKEKINTPIGMFNVGDKISSKVVHLSPHERRIGLSIRRIDEEEEGAFEDYMGKSKEATSNLGELIMNQLNADKD